MAAVAALSPLDVLAHAAALFTYSDPLFGPIERLWGDVEYEYFLAQEAAQTPAQAAAKAAAEAAERARWEAEAEEARKSSYAQDCKYRNTVRQGRVYSQKKVALPCKNLYYDESLGSANAPLRAALTGSECWAWERKKGSVVLKPHTCSHLHPGEEGWLPEWNRNRAYRPNVADAGLAAWGAARR